MELVRQIIFDSLAEINGSLNDESKSISLIKVISDATKSDRNFAVFLSNSIMMQAWDENEQARVRICMFKLIGKVLKDVGDPYRQQFDENFKLCSKFIFDGFQSHELLQIKEIIFDWMNANVLNIMVTNDLLLEIYDRLEGKQRLRMNFDNEFISSERQVMIINLISHLGFK
jgi:hypothetical protein